MNQTPITSTQAKILVVDDELLIATDIMHIAKHAGYQSVSIAGSVDDAIQKSTDLRPDLVIMDIMLKDRIDGIETAEIIKNKVDPAFIFISAYSDYSSLERTKVVAPYAFLIKPFVKAQLIFAIETALHKHYLETRLRESESRFKVLFDGINDAAFVHPISPDGAVGKFIEVNSFASELLGFTKEEFLQLSPIELNPVENFARVKEISRFLVDNRKMIFQSSLLHKDRTLVYCEFSSQLLMIDGTSHVLSIVRDISERKQMIDMLQKEKNLLRTIIDNLPNTIYMKDTKLRKLISNPADLKVIGKTADEVLGKTDFDVFPYEMAKDMFDLDNSVIKSGKPIINRESSFVSDDGRVHQLLISKIPLRDNDGVIQGLVGIGQDISDRKLIEKKIRMQEEKLKLIIDLLPVGVILTDKKGFILECNASIEKLLNIAPQKTLQLNIKTVCNAFFDEDYKLIQPDQNPGIIALEKQRPLRNVIVGHKRDDGQITWLSMHAIPLPIENYGVAITFNDITALKITEEESRKLNSRLVLNTQMLESRQQQLNETIKRLQDSEAELRQINLEKDRFYSIIAHDLRSPFNGLLGLSDILSQESDTLSTEEIRQMASALNSISVSAYRLLENLLAWSRLHTKTISFTPKTVQMNALIQDALEISLASISQKGITLKQTLHKHDEVFCDENMIATVIRNILSNAIKFTPQNGQILISSMAADRYLTISIQDSGIGIPEDKISDLFKIDKQFVREGTHKEKGSGLGLLLCKEFVEKNNGELQIWSTQNAGTKVSISIPRKKQ